MIVEANDVNENLIDDTNINNKQEKLSIEKTAAKSDSINKLDINKENNLNSNINNNNINNNYNEDINSNNPKASIGNVIIEDNIKKTDTVIFSNEKKNKKIDNDNENEIIYEGDEDLESKKVNKNNKNKIKSNFRYHININENFLKYATLVIIIIYIILTIICCVNYHQNRDKSPFLFCFEFLERKRDEYQDKSSKDIIYFLTDLNSFYIIHFILFSIFIYICYMLIKGTQSQIKEFFKDMSIFFLLCLVFNIPILFCGLFTENFYGDFVRPVVYTILTFLGLLCLIKIFIVAKRHKYKNVSSLINISILSSFMTAYQCYCFLFNLAYFYMNFYGPKIEENKENKEYPEVEIIAGCIYFAIGIIIMTVFKDIFFVIAMVIIENGLLYTKRKNPYLLTTALFNISIVSLNFASIIIIIFAYNKKVFRLKENQ